MRNNIAVGICFMTLGGFTVLYSLHHLKLDEMLLFTALVWQLTGWWLDGRLKSNLKRKVTDFRPQRVDNPISRTILRASLLLSIAGFIALFA